LVSSDHSSGIFWLPIWYRLIAPSIFPDCSLASSNFPFVSSDYPFCIFLFPLRYLPITPFVSSDYSFVSSYNPFVIRVITVFTVFRLLTDFVCLYNYEFWLSLCKIVRSSVILLLPLFIFLFPFLISSNFFLGGYWDCQSLVRRRVNQNPSFDKEQTTQWPKEKVQKDKQRSATHTHKTKDRRRTRTPLKPGMNSGAPKG
jgi:hypothetical protein